MCVFSQHNSRAKPWRAMVAMAVWRSWPSSADLLVQQYMQNPNVNDQPELSDADSILTFTHKWPASAYSVPSTLTHNILLTPLLRSPHTTFYWHPCCSHHSTTLASWVLSLSTEMCAAWKVGSSPTSTLPVLKNPGICIQSVQISFTSVSDSMYT